MEKHCNFCENPLHEIRLGPKRTRLWVHRGKELETCKAFKLDRDILQDLIKVMHKLRKHGPLKLMRKKDGEVVVFGEENISTAD